MAQRLRAVGWGERGEPQLLCCRLISQISLESIQATAFSIRGEENQFDSPTLPLLTLLEERVRSCNNTSLLHKVSRASPRHDLLTLTTSSY